LLVYSTCTFAPEENEQRIAAFLVAHPDWELVDLPKPSGIAPAQGHWADPPVPELERAARLWPQRVRGEGHFVAALRKVVDDQPPRPASVTPSPRQKNGNTATTPPQMALTTWQAFAQQTLRTNVPVERLHFTNGQIYLLPQDRLPLEGVRTVRPGLWLGTIKPGRFEPSHALALTLDADDAQTTVDLSLVEGERYLHGETITRSGASGWVLVAVDGWPLGWGRRTGDLVKNHYPKGLRWLK
jgi:NOL1/NOP2/fmu family ribosome biogenesis protein